MSSPERRLSGTIGPVEAHRPSPWLVRAGILVPVVVLLGFLAWAMFRHQQSQEIASALARGESPPVPAGNFARFDGGRLSLTDFRGHPVVLNFWASWCVPCADEAPILEAIWDEFRGQGVVVIGVDTQDLEAPGKGFVRRHGLTYPNVRDPDGSLAHIFGTTGVPETFFVDAAGRVRGKFPGEQTERSAWRAAVEALLAGRSRVP